MESLPCPCAPSPRELGTSAGSLYRYLSSRDDLLDLMTDRAAGELRPYPEADGDWLDTMLLLARRQLALHQRHRWLLDVVQRPSGIGPESLAWIDNCLRVLEPVRCAVTAKFEAIAMMTGVVSLIARSEAGSGSMTFAGLDIAAFPHLAAAFSQPAGPTPQADLFERTLRILLTGLLVPEPPTCPEIRSSVSARPRTRLASVRRRWGRPVPAVAGLGVRDGSRGARP